MPVILNNQVRLTHSEFDALQAQAANNGIQLSPVRTRDDFRVAFFAGMPQQQIHSVIRELSNESRDKLLCA
jgi:hypothetical protein